MARSLTFLPAALGIVALAVSAAGCGSPAEDSKVGPDRCETVMAKLAACYPEARGEAACTQATLDAYDQLDLESKSCEDVEAAGKADWFAFGGCDDGQHVCAGILCCDDYVLQWSPQSESDWDIVPAIDAYQAEVPVAVADELEAATANDLRKGMGWSYAQMVSQAPGAEPENMAVELTARLYDVTYEDFARALPVEQWGVNIAHYLGGEVKVYQRDGSDRPIRQVERMVISALPCDWDVATINNDMTKVEVIRYEEGRAKVYWRVMHSDNLSTEADVGSVEFVRTDDDATLVIFHSAHRLNAMGGIHIPTEFVLAPLTKTFLDHLENYGRVVGAY